MKYLDFANIYGDLFPELTASEASVLWFIAQRTLRYGKGRERIPYRHFLQGIPGTIGPVGLPERSLTRGIFGLERKGLLLVSRRNRAPSDFEIVCNMALRISKKYRGATDTMTVESTAKSVLHKELKGEGVETTPRRRRRAREVVEEVTQSNRQRRRKKADKAGDGRYRWEDVWAAWREARVECGLTTPPAAPTKKQQTIILRQLQRYGHTFQLPLREFMVWALQSWRALLRGRYKHLKDLASPPDLYTFATTARLHATSYEQRSELANVREEQAERQEQISRREQDLLGEIQRLRKERDFWKHGGT